MRAAQKPCSIHCCGVSSLQAAESQCRRPVKPFQQQITFKSRQVSDTASENAPCSLGRRQLLAGGAMLLSTRTTLFGPPALADEEFREVQDGTLAYKFLCPTRTASGKPLSVIFSRPPERYSSAAPLTPDARQRIVAELVDFLNGVTMSVTVGPPSGALQGLGPAEWGAKQVAEAVLADRSTSRVTAGQRVALNSIESTAAENRDGATYWVYEHISQGSPSLSNPGKETYRHAYAVTTWRPALDGTPYLYTLNVTCAEDKWADLAPVYQKSIESFRLTQPTQSYVPPDKEPWRFF